MSGTSSLGGPSKAPVLPGRLGPNPFVGPRSIQQGELLYGRSVELRELFNRLQARRIVVLHSPSGAGKSSLVQAGLIPKLKQANFDVWKPMRVNLDARRLEGIPAGTNRYLLSAMISLEEELPEARRRSPAQLASLDFETYLDTRPRRKRRGGSSVVLLFDQFEELLTVEPRAVAQKDQFFTAVGQALDTGKYWALFIIREDFLAAFAPYRDRIPTQMANTFRLDLLGLAGAREAAEQLALTGGRTFPAVDQLVRDLSAIRVQQPDGSFMAEQGLYVEPVQLQVVCRRLWEAMPDDDLSIDAEDIEAYASVSEALGLYYSRAVAKIAQADLAVERSIREWVGNGLIVGGIRSQVRQETGSSGGLDNALITELLGSYLVRTEQRAGSNWFELSHDRLVQPVQLDNETWDREHLHPLQVQAKLWEHARRSVGLLLSAEALPGAFLWAAANPTLVTEQEREFLQLSSEQRAAEAKEHVRAQLVRRVFGIAAIVSACLAVVMGAGVIWALQQKRVAERATAAARRAHAQLEINETKMRRLLAEQRGRRAQMLIPENSEGQALMLALQAVGVFADLSEDPPPAAREGLERVLMDDTVIIDDSLALVGHRKTVSAIAYSPAGDRLASTSHDGTAAVWDPSTGTRVATLEGHEGEIAALAYAPGGDRLATAGHDSTARIWDPSTGELLRTLEGHENVVYGVAYSPDGAHLATASWDRTARIWDASTGELLHTLEGHDKVVYTVAYSPDGARLATNSKDTTARIWDASTGELLQILAGHGGTILALAYSPDSPDSPDQATVATGSNDNTARIWDLETGELLHTLEGHTHLVFALAYSPDGTALATGSYDDSVRVWNTSSGKLAMTLQGHESPVRSVAFSPDGLHLASASKDTTVRVWDTSTRQLTQTFIGHENEAWQVVFAPKGDHLASASKDGTVRVWAFSTDSVLATLRGHRAAIHGAAYSPSGARLATASYDGTARIWDPATGELIKTLEGHAKELYAIQYSPDGAQLATASKDTTARLWDAETGKLLNTLEGHTASVKALAYSPDGAQLATASFDKTARVWDPATGAQLLSLEGHENQIRALAYSPDSAHLATASTDHMVRVWDPTTGALEQTLEGHDNYVYTLVYSPDGAHIVSGSWDSSARIWDPVSGESTPLEGHKNVVYGVAYSPDGDRVATASSDRHVKIWNPVSAELVATLTGHTNEVWSVAYSPDGSRLATAGKEGTARLWDPSTNQLVAKLEGHLGPINDLVFSPDGATLVTVSDDHTARVWDAANGELLTELEDRVGLVGADGSVEWPAPLPTLTRIACERLESVRAFADEYRQVAELCDPLLRQPRTSNPI